MQLFTVIRKGVYRHEQIGVFDSEDKACEAAIAALLKEYDEYHTMLIVSCHLNSLAGETFVWEYFTLNKTIHKKSLSIANALPEVVYA